jgi:hypothetical protein
VSADRIEQLKEQAYALPYSASRLALLDEALRLAIIGNDVDETFELRMAIIHDACQIGREDKIVVEFSNLLKTYKTDPDRFSDYRLYWYFKWAIGNAVDFPNISADRIRQLTDEMQQWYSQMGYSLRTVEMVRSRVEKNLGNLDAANRYHAAAENYPLDSMSDCKACNTSHHADLKMLAGEYEEALAIAEPILAGRQSCQSIPHTTYAEFAFYSALHGVNDSVNDYANRAMRLTNGSMRFIGATAYLLAVRVGTGQTRSVRALIERNIGNASQTIVDESRARFYQATGCAMLSFSKSSKPKRSFRLPAALPLYRHDGEYQTAELAEWFFGEASSIAGKYDARNENKHFSKLLADFRVVAKLDA